MATVSLRAVSKTYPGSFPAVRDLSLDIREGEFVVLVGPSGCGKSTTLRLIAGLESPDQGDILFDGASVAKLQPKDRDIAMVFQNYALYPHMSVRENMAFSLRLRAVPRAQVRERVDRVAAMLDISDLLDRRPGQLSGGQKQRVAVGRAIVREPRVFLLDEPLSNLDARLRLSTRAELKALHQRLRVTTIYVTHDQEEAMTLADRVAVLDGGKLQQFDFPMRLYRFPRNRFVAGFIGSPAMNFVSGVISRVASGEFEFAESAAPDERRVGAHAGVSSGVGAREQAGCGGLRVVLPRFPSGGKESDAGADFPPEVVLGFRPSALRVARPGATSATLSVRVVVVEPLGDQADVTGLTAGGTRIVARVAVETLPAHLLAGDAARGGAGGGSGSVLECEIDAAGLHVFEAGAHGRRLWPSAAEES